MKKIILALFLGLILNACKTTQEIKDGSLAFQLKKYELAKKLLPEEISSAKSTDKITKVLELAESYRFSNEPENAAKWYQKALDEGGKNVLLFDLAMMQKQSEDYEAALATLEKYKKITYDELRSVPEISICKKAILETSKPNNMSVENLEKINSTQSDFSTTIYKNNTLIIASSRKEANSAETHPWTGEKNTDLFIIDPKSGSVTAFDTIINTNFPEANITFNKDFSVAYFTRCDFGNDPNVNGYCHIFKTEKDGDTWYKPEMLKLFDDTINVGQAFLAPDGNRLYFSAEAPFGYGGKDIYFVDIKNGEIGSPINAGYSVNTAKDELFPTMDSKGNLYFSSNGRTGYGGLDIFKAKPENKGFGQAQQMPYPINSGADDFSLVFTKEFDGVAKDGLIEEAYFTSTRKGGKGNDDIYYYKKELFNTFKLELYVEEKSFENPEDDASKFLGMIALLEAEVSLSPIGSDEKTKEISDKIGKTEFPLMAETDYKVLVSKKDYFNKSVIVSSKNLKDIQNFEIIIRDTVELAKIFPEKEIVIENIYYDLDKANLRPESLPVLDVLVTFFQENNDLTIEIGSHTDSRGSDEYNQDLSQRRAQSVVDYFISKGIPKQQLIAKGYGETKILNQCVNDVECTEEEHQKNRRTSFRVVSAKGVLESK